jgi:hypothetical protein
MDHLPPRSKEGTLKLQQGHRKGRTLPPNLREQVDPQTMAMYPTPNAWDGMRGPRSEKHIRENPNSQITLVTKVAQIERKKMYPTPRTGAGSRPNGKGGKVLEEEVMIEAGLRERGKTLKQMYPTPVAKDNCSESLESWEKRAEKHKEQGKTIPKALRIKVQEEAKMYPTPTTQDSRIGPNNIKGSEHRKKRGSPALADSILFPTPTARDYKDMGYKPSWKPSRDKSLPREVLKSNTHGGRLNVNFVEFLMGFPTNYSEIESVE